MSHFPNMPLNSPHWHLYKKSAGVCTVTRPTARGLRITHLSRTSNAEAYAEYEYRLGNDVLTPCPTLINHIRRHLLLLHP